MQDTLRRSGPGLLLVTLILPLLAMVSGFADAAPAPFAEQGWGVYNSVTSGTLTDAVDTEVMAIEQIGDRIFVGGKFTEVRQFNTAAPVSRRFLAAFDADTGAYIPSFTPDLSGPVYALERSPDGSRLFVGGEFADVAGVPNTKALVALNPNTGAVDTSYIPTISRNGRAVVYALDQAGSHLFVGGGFDAVQGTSRSNAAKLNVNNAALDTTWSPTVTGGTVWGIAAAPNQSKVYLSGYFTEVNGVDGTEGFVPVSNNTGSVQPGRVPHNTVDRRFYLDVEAVNNLVFIAGSEHIMWVMNATTNEIVTQHSTGGFGADFTNGGDFQDVEVVGDRVYAGCHCRGNHYANGDVYLIDQGEGGTFSREDPIKFVAAYSATTGAYIPSFQLDVSGSSGAWGIHGSSDGCLWVGGDLTRATRADGTNQARGGFTRHCDDGGGNDGGGNDNGGGDDGGNNGCDNNGPDTERPDVPTGLTATASGSHIALTWNPTSDNVGVTGYELRRANTEGGPGSLIATPSGTSYTDTALAPGTYFYYLRAVDAAGNVGYRTGYKSATIGGGGNDGGGNDGGGNDADTERPGQASGLRATANGTTAAVTWNAATDNVGVVSYQVYRATSNGGDATQIGTSSNTNYNDAGLANGTYWYYLRAVDAAGNVGWRTGYTSVTITDNGGGGGDNDTERPSTPIGFRLNSNTSTTASFSWTGSTDDVGVVEYRIHNANGSVRASTTSGTSIVVTGLTPNQSYAWHVKAYDAAGNASWRSNVRTFTTD